MSPRSVGRKWPVSGDDARSFSPLSIARTHFFGQVPNGERGGEGNRYLAPKRPKGKGKGGRGTKRGDYWNIFFGLVLYLEVRGDLFTWPLLTKVVSFPFCTITLGGHVVTNVFFGSLTAVCWLNSRLHRSLFFAVSTVEGGR